MQRQQEVTCTRDNDSSIVWTAATAFTRPAPRPEIVFGSIIRLSHKQTGQWLSSNVDKYFHEGGSRRQMVTCNTNKKQVLNQWWQIEAAHGVDTATVMGKPISQGTAIRLRHMNSGKYLRAEAKYCAPTTPADTEISCVGDDVTRSADDNWQLQWPMMPIAVRWAPGQLIRLVHCKTGHKLRSHRTHIEMGIVTRRQQEVSGLKGADSTCWWEVCNIKTK